MLGKKWLSFVSYMLSNSVKKIQKNSNKPKEFFFLLKSFYKVLKPSGNMLKLFFVRFFDNNSTCYAKCVCCFVFYRLWNCVKKIQKNSDVPNELFFLLKIFYNVPEPTANILKLFHVRLFNYRNSACAVQLLFLLFSFLLATRLETS